MRLRLDKLLLDRGLASSRERAQALIIAGLILVNEQKITKPGTAVDDGAILRRLGGGDRYVSRGGQKLEAALEHWKINLSQRHTADIGASTGGFTDCMLQHGAISVAAVDTGYGQIAQKLRDDPRVSLRERTNVRYLEPGSLPRSITFFSMDVSFISATMVLAPVLNAIAPEPGTVLEAVVLVKPQFEVGRERVGKGGIVRDPKHRQEAVDRVRCALEQLHGECIEVIDSPVLGAKGNHEFLLHVVWHRIEEALES